LATALIMYKLSLKIALRNLWKNITSSLINIGGLAIGLTSCMLLLLYVHYEWSFDKQFKSIDRIYAVYDHSRMADQINTSRENDTPNQLASAAEASIPGIEYITRIVRNGAIISYNQNSYEKAILYVDPSFLKIFDYKFLKGNASTALATPNSIVLTQKTAKILFGSEEPVGKIVKFDQKKDLVVAAVIEDLPANQTYQFDMLLTWKFMEQDNSSYTNMDWNDGALSTIIQLKKGADFTAADAQMRKIFKQHFLKDDFKTFFLFPFRKVHLYNNFENGKLAGGRIQEVKLYLLLAACILLLACINYMNLSTARSEKRAREVGIRKTLGSSKTALRGQFILESIFLSLLAMILAFVMLEASLPYFNQLLDIKLTLNYNDYNLWTTIILLTLLTGALAGSYPSFYLSSFEPAKVLKGFTAAATGALPVRKILVVVQFGVSICMIIFAIVVYSQIQYMKNKPLGFNQENLVQEYRIGGLADYGKANLLKTQLLESGAVTAVTINSGSLTSNILSTEAIRWPGQQHKEQLEIQLRFTDYDFSKTIGVEMVKGRDFSPRFGTDSMGVILNETAAKMMGLKDPVGQKIRNEDWNQELTIIGVMKDYNYASLGSKVEPVLFFLSEKNCVMFLMRLNPKQNISTSLSKIKELTVKANPGYPANIEFVSDKLLEKLKTQRLLSVLANVFGGFAILISCMGLLGLALFTAEQRKKEISVRKVLGANLKDIMVLLNKDFLKLVIISNLLAIPVAYLFVFKWLQNYDYRISLSAWPFLTALLLSIFIATVTISLQIFKVSKANPIDALKYE
jgi:putative ABC transport system permease protein